MSLSATAVPPAPIFGLVPLVVAVTGHRDIPADDIHKLTVAVKAWLNEIAARYPHSPCLLLSGLAEGADRLAAALALEAGWRIGAVLPLPQEECEKDFAGADSIAQFRGLLARCEWTRVVCDVDVPRPQCYRLLGEWLASHSQVLLALWDGKPSDALGGTADVVKLFEEGMLQERPILPDAGPVVHVMTRRLGNLAHVPESEIGELTIRQARPAGLTDPWESARRERVWQRIDDYNANADEALKTRPQELAKAREYLNGGVAPDDDALPTSALAASWLHAAADCLSQQAQKERKRVFLQLMGFALLAIFFEQLYSGPFPWPGWMAAAIVSGMTGVALYWRGLRNQLEVRYLDYRGLAEACRVQYFWKLAGIETCAAQYYLREQQDDLEWLRQAVATTELGPEEIDSCNPEVLDKVRTCWIEDQFNYFAGHAEKAGKAKANARCDVLWNKRAGNLLLAGIGVTVAAAIFHGFWAEEFEEVGEGIVQGLIVLYGMLFAFAGVSKLYQETEAFAEQANRYQRMALSMKLALRQVDAALGKSDMPAAKHALQMIGQEALAENGDWLLVHRERPVKLPIGG